MRKRSPLETGPDEAAVGALTPPGGGPEVPQAATYVSPLILRSMAEDVDRATPWIDEVVGTLVMVDVSGFTRLSERLAASGREGSEILTDIINWYFQQMLDIAKSNQGFNLKFGGDALLLFFQDAGHEERAVRTALEMQRANRGFSAFRAGPDKVRLKMSIGVHTGRFWSCAVGDPDRRMQHIVFGEEVNRVALVEAEAEAGEVLVSAETLSRIDVPVTSTPRGEYHRVRRLHGRGVASVSLEAAPIATERLSAYLPPPLLPALASGQREIGAEHRRVVILFIHLLGIEKVANEGGAAEALRQLQEYTGSLVDLTQKYGGFLVANDIYNEGVKFIVVFGAPVAREDDSANALRLAVALKESLKRSGLALEQRIGVNAGHVFAGDVGATHRREYTVMGDAVNLSARLMSAASAGQILVSEQTLEEVESLFSSRRLSPIRVKGKRAEIPIAELEGESKRAPSTSQTTELVGREEELERLREVCLQAEGGSGRTVAIHGEAGIGKSRLSLEFSNYLEARGWVTHRASCYSHTSGNFFEPWAQLLRSLMSVNAEHAAPERGERVLQFLQEHQPALVPLASLLNGLLGADLAETDLVASLDEESRRARLFDIVADLFRHAAERSRVALFIEDIDHADQASVELLSHVHGRLAGCRSVICVTYRTREERTPALPRDVVSIDLKPLERASLTRLTKALLQTFRVPEALLSVMAERSKGNPLFLEEMSRSIRRSGELQSAIAQGKPVPAAMIPDRLQTLVMSRIDQLTGTARETLRAASIVGTRFEPRIVTALLAVTANATQVQRNLASLEAEEILDRDRDGRTMIFRHSLVQEVTYESLPYSRRRQMHISVAHYIEESESEEALASQYAMLAHHYDRGGDRPKTFDYSVKAGDQARAAFANEEATRLYSRAVSLAGAVAAESATVARVYTSLGDVLELAARHDEAIKAYARGVETCLGRRLRVRTGTVPRPRIPRDALRGRPHRIRRSLSELARKIAYVCDRVSDYDAALAWFRQAIDALPRGAGPERGMCSIGLAGILYRAGEYKQAAGWARNGLRLIEQGGAGPELAHAHNLLGVIYRDAGRAKLAIGHRLDALGMYKELNQRIGQADTLNNLGLDHLALGDWDSAVKAFRECIGIAEEIGDVELVAIVNNNLGEVFVCQGEFTEARRVFRSAIEMASGLGNVAVASLAEANLGEVIALGGDVPLGRDHLQRSLRAFRRIGAQSFMVDAQIRVAETYLAEGQLERAMSFAERGMGGSRETGSLPLEARALQVIGNVYGRRRDWGSAEANLENARAIFGRIGERYREAKVRQSLAEVYAGQNSGMGRRRAEREIARAIEIFEKLGARDDLSRARLIAGSVAGFPSRDRR